MKDSLMKLLPEVDCVSVDSVSEMFTSNEFLNSLQLFQRHLHHGTFDSSQDVVNYRRAKKFRERDPWKVIFSNFISFESLFKWYIF